MISPLMQETSDLYVVSHTTGGHSGSVVDFYPGCVWFEFLLGHQLPWMRFFVIFPSSSRHMPGIYFD
jgi:hypothetical protein